MHSSVVNNKIEKKTITENNDNSCVICLDSIERKNFIYLCPCKHNQFHKQCVEMWIEMKNECPLCRGKIKFKFDSKQFELANQPASYFNSMQQG